MSKRSLVLLALIVTLGISTSAFAQDEAQPLPFPTEFDATKYLGKWYEAARMPTPVQPNDSLATAEYTQGASDDEVLVKNTAYNKDGKAMIAMKGKAKLLPGGPPRLAVSFGPIKAAKPNYFVMHVDDEYQAAVVGTPDRRSLWILVRDVPVAQGKLNALIDIARKAGFKTDKLLIAPWKAPAASAVDLSKLIGKWTYRSGEKDGVKLDQQHFQGQRVEITKESLTLIGDEFKFVLSYEPIADTDPQQFKFTITESPFGAGQTTTGIMKLDGDRLELCYSPMGGATPKKFEAPEGSQHHYFVLDRKVKAE